MSAHDILLVAIALGVFLVLVALAAGVIALVHAVIAATIGPWLDRQ